MLKLWCLGNAASIRLATSIIASSTLASLASRELDSTAAGHKKKQGGDSIWKTGTSVHGKIRFRLAFANDDVSHPAVDLSLPPNG